MDFLRFGEEYIAGAIIVGGAPCMDMAFVWSYLTDGDPNYTCLQVSVITLNKPFIE
jgi:ACR3 family arsenite efflux pump ArsB